MIEKNKVTRLFFRFFIIRAILFFSLLAFYYTINWRGVAYILRECIYRGLTNLNYSVYKIDAGGEFLLRVNDYKFIFNSNCTYIDLLLLALPLAFGSLRTINKSILIYVFTSVLILTINYFRVMAAILLNIKGIEWKWCHEIPDVVIHAIILSILIITTMSRDLAQAKKTILNSVALHNY